ncbi:hypothetical protein GCM10010433_73190 [Streptomyces pulveraceus]|uniref:DUF2063 domain-containing protein n=1 Tax=Streptomyces pulveraceus TaxID=68258 RepID=A0ABW1GN78_9ACTN
MTSSRPSAPHPARRRLDAALDGLAVTFRGMTAHPDEDNCECHWGSAEELALLKVPDVDLDDDLLQRTWRPSDWSDHAAVLRRILPQFARSLVAGGVEPFLGPEEIGRSFARGHWRQWPAEQAGAVREFLHAWWAHTLTDPAPAVPAHELLALLAEASGALTPWLAHWETQTGTPATRHLVEAADHWEYHLLGDALPWDAWDSEDDGEERRAELTAWLLHHARPRLVAHGAPAELLHRIRLLGLTGPARWEDPHWPHHRY